jgi:hypothetical protein
MRYLCMLVLLLAGAGCAADGEKSQWDEVLKDLRGDNMQMRGFSSNRSDK